jgi:hypothetical protein
VIPAAIVVRTKSLQAKACACLATAEPEEIAAVLAGLTFGHLDDLDARLKEMEPILGKELADKVDAYPEFEPVVEGCLAIAQGVAKAWRRMPKGQRPATKWQRQPRCYSLRPGALGSAISVSTCCLRRASALRSIRIMTPEPDKSALTTLSITCRGRRR